MAETNNIITTKIPRIVIASTSSGGGKTTVTLAIMAALCKRGGQVQGYKCGPDYIDPGYHSVITGRVSRNLDSWFVNAELLKRIFVRSYEGSDICVIEGVMGLFDGRSPFTNEGSTFEVAEILSAPIILVVDVKKMARSAAAIVKGFAEFNPEIQIAGVVANRPGSEGHYCLVRDAIEQECEIPVMGYLPNNDDMLIPERHLGLLPALEKGDHNELFSVLAEQAEKTIHLDRLIEIANASLPIACDTNIFDSLVKPSKSKIDLLKSDKSNDINKGYTNDDKGSYKKGYNKNFNYNEDNVIVAVAKDEAFNFYYPENLELLELCGMKVEYFSPLHGESPHEQAAALYIGGGFPEVFAEQLSRQIDTNRKIHSLINAGLPTIAECGGFMYLTRELIDTDNNRHSMVAALSGRVIMQKKRAALGYREVHSLPDSIFLPKVEAIIPDSVKGHEFHYSRYEVDPNEKLPSAYRLTGRYGSKDQGVVYKQTLAGYLHFYFPSQPQLVENFRDAAISFKEKQL